MNRVVLLEHLQLARKHVAQGFRHLTRQAELIDRLRGQGVSTDDAELFLSQLQASQTFHKASVARIERELAMPRTPFID